MVHDATLSVELSLALRDRHFTLEASFEAPSGITILFGPSGSGKSTTLAAIAGLLHADAGRIAFGEEVWFDKARGIDLPPERRGLAFVFQSLALFPHMTARANVEYGIDRRLARGARRDRAMEMLERMHVPHLAERKPRTFSGGEAQRVALARAFARSPKIVILDEAFSAMDRELRIGLLTDVRRYVEEKKLPVLLVTHHRNEARAMGDRAILFEKGRIKASGAIDTLIPAFGADPAHSQDVGFEAVDRTPWPKIEETP